MSTDSTPSLVENSSRGSPPEAVPAGAVLPVDSALVKESGAWLARRLQTGERWLIRRVLHYALSSGFSEYTAQVEEAWVASVRGISEPLREHLLSGGTVHPIRAREDALAEPGTAFGRAEARLHRVRGIPLGMFLSFYKYYRRAYVELLDVPDEKLPPSGVLDQARDMSSGISTASK